MDGINKVQQQKIDREVSSKKELNDAVKDYKARQIEARHRIEDLKELKKLQDDYLNDYEDL